MTEWTSVPFWTVAHRVERTGNPDGRLLSVYRDWGVVPKDSRDDNFNRASEDLSTYKVVHVGDLVLNKMKTWQGSLGVSQHDGIVSPAYFVCELSPRVHGRFLHHLLRSQATIASFKANSKGIRPNQWDLPYEILHDIQLLLPELEEQRRIADFLDDRVARIDQIIAARQQQTAQAREAAVAEHQSEFVQLVTRYGTTRLGRCLARLEQGWSPQADSQPAEGAEWGVMRAGCVNGGAFREEDNKRLPDHFTPRVEYEIKPGDLLMSRASGSLDLIGSIAVVPASVRPRLLLPDKIYRLTPGGDWTSEFLAHAVRSYRNRELIRQGTSGAEGMANNLPSQTVRDLEIPAVPLSDQAALNSSLAAANEALTRFIAAVDTQVALLQEYKQSLITAAVTGAFDVATASTRIPE